MADANEPLGITTNIPDGQSPTPVYQTDTGIPAMRSDIPYQLSDGCTLAKPLPVVDAGGPVWVDYQGNAVSALAINDLTPTPPDPVPGPLDYLENGEGMDRIVVEYDLARPVAMMGIAFRHTGPVTTLTATHGGEPLRLVSFVLNDVDNTGAAMFIGNGLKIEPANLVITPVGGKIGPAVVRIDDSFQIEDVQVGVVGPVFGFSYIGAASQPPVVRFDPVDGNGWGVYALAVSGAEASSYARGWNGAAPTEVLFGAPASSGALKNPPAWVTPAAGWSNSGGWWMHNGDAYNYLSGEPFATPVPNPFWWEIEVDVPEGNRLYVQTIGGGGHLSETFLGPIKGVFRRYRHQSYSANSFRIQANGAAKFRNFRYCDNGQVVYGAFGRTVNKVPNGSGLQFQIGKLSRYAGVIAEVYDGATPRWLPFTLTAGDSGEWFGYSSGDLAYPPFNPPMGSISNEPNQAHALMAMYVDMADSTPVAIFHGDIQSDVAGLKLQINAYKGTASDISLFAGNTVIRFAPAFLPLNDGQTYGVVFTPAGD